MTIMKRVLVIEDDQPIRHFVVTALVDEGFHVAAAPDGRAGLERCAEFNPDLVLLDLTLPEVDGLEFLRRSRDICAAPVIVMSSPHEREQLPPNAPVRGFVDKPFSLDHLLATVKTSLQYN